MRNRGQITILKVQFKRNSQEACLPNTIAEEFHQLTMPGSVDALFQETVEGAAQHLPEILNASKQDVAPDRVVVPLDQMANEGGERALADPALAADEADTEAASCTTTNHAAQALDFGVPANEELDRHRLPRPERT